MKEPPVVRTILGLGALIAAVAVLPVSVASAAPAQAPAPAATSASSSAAASTSRCPEVALTQPFAGDSNWYTLAPGESADDFAGTGWTLTGGARIVSTTLKDGATGDVLDLPAGATATSPAMCVDSDYPTVRMVTRTLGRAPDNSTSFYTVPVATGRPAGGMPVLGTTAWATSPPDNVSAGGSSEQVQFKYVAGSKAADLQVYDFYVDPRMSY